MGLETILWPNLKSLSCMIELDNEFEYEPASCLEVVECRSRELKKHCVLRLFGTEALWWKRNDPDTWKHLQEKGFYERIGGYWYEGDIDYIPWPPRAKRIFHSPSSCLTTITNSRTLKTVEFFAYNGVVTFLRATFSFVSSFQIVPISRPPLDYRVSIS
ncbi:hypothetical protein CPB84DRAFT_929077 [Gymnopilus junonius]|uniref:Uncharacterized protein n=1 Tax=Gymnopilus junonius TaxID=109634 RepID=A0A9P5P0X1_GYMJU|nr:hypothetical protein CPB84DRAFT_929077 [Gymnopilus junonius]